MLYQAELHSEADRDVRAAIAGRGEGRKRVDLLRVTIARTRNRVFADTPFEHHRENDMKLWKCVAIFASLVALTGPALAQGDVITARQDGLKGVARQMESIKAVVDQRGDPRATAAAIGEIGDARERSTPMSPKPS